jgi:hypothetical protein
MGTENNRSCYRRMDAGGANRMILGEAVHLAFSICPPWPRQQITEVSLRCSYPGVYLHGAGTAGNFHSARTLIADFLDGHRSRLYRDESLLPFGGLTPAVHPRILSRILCPRMMLANQSRIVGVHPFWRYRLLAYFLVLPLSAHVGSRFVDYGSPFHGQATVECNCPHQKHQDLRRDAGLWAFSPTPNAILHRPEISRQSNPSEPKIAPQAPSHNIYIRPPPSPAKLNPVRH